MRGLAVFGERYGLERIQALLGALDEPQRGRAAIHVVGSNGKTSTVRLAAAALRAAGLRTGSYVSPHVTDWSERIHLDGQPVSGARFAQGLDRVRAAAHTLDEPVTQFEVLTATALVVFADARVDALVIEAGLGGRFDATNVLDRAVVALTRVDLEHTALLGETGVAIADEKLAVVRPGVPALLVGPVDVDVAERARESARRVGARLLRAGHEFGYVAAGERMTLRTERAEYRDLRPPAGTFQRDNLALAVAAAEELLSGPVPARRLGALVAGVRVAGRWERLPGRPELIFDGAHNPAAAAVLADEIEALELPTPPVLVVSMLDEKDADGVLRVLSGHVEVALATESGHPRARPAAELAQRAAAHGIAARAEPEPERAFALARTLAGPSGVVLVTGSLYLIERLRQSSVERGE